MWNRRIAGLVGLLVLASGAVLITHTADAAVSKYNYAEALQKAIWFYDAQREGKLPATNRVPWRADSFLADGQDVGLDLVGGFADAGDTIKATFPLVHALGALAWGMVDYPSGYTASGQDTYLLSNLRWGMDYLIKANPSADTLVTEVGDPNKDHQLWAAAEVQTYHRDTYLMKASTCWGADLADSAAATFAAASMVYASRDPAYAATLLAHAKGLYATTEATAKQKYDTCTPIVSGFYNSWSGYTDELVYGSLWLYRATGDTSYLDRAKAYYKDLPKSGQSSTDPIKYTWTFDWDDKTAASFILMAKLTGDAQALTDATRWADYNAGAGVNGAKVTTSPGGEAFYGDWGSLRYSAGAAFIAFVLADSGRLDATRNTQLHDFAVRQINYILGDNPSNLSYMVGFGANSIKRPHHRTAHGPWSNNFYEPVEDRHTLYGGMVGGPTAANDTYGAEDRNAYQKAEVALDYNAGLTSALARLVQEYGGKPLAGLPDDPKDNELYMTASLNQAGSNFVEIKSLWYNHTAWPARFTPNISFRYYFTLDAGQSAADVKLQVAYAQCADPTGPTPVSGSTYYVTISCAGQQVGPIGQSESRRENQFRITFPGPHDYTKDWSYQGVSPTQSSPVTVTNIPMFDGAQLVWGSLPGGGTTTSPSPSGSPSRSASPSPSASASASASASRSASPPPPGGCAVTYATDTWTGGFTANVTVANRGSVPVTNWGLSFTLPSGQAVTSVWNATLTATSGATTARGAAWAADIAANGSASFGFQGTYTGTFTKPSSFTLNGTACSTS
jgi:endoglucanase